MAGGVLRLCTAGSVDDGKSTLIGRLLYDTRVVYNDQVRAVERASRHRALPLDFSLFTDGLRAEREQGITIDVAYRYFATARRRFILADTPGHEQYTRNMATGASTAELAILLVDVRHGIRDQTRRHAAITRLMGIRHIVLAVNKMDLVEFREEPFRQVTADFEAVADGASVQAIPLSAVHGDNVVARSARLPWYSGPSLIEYLETVEVDSARADGPFRLPVQYVVRAGDVRGCAGQVTSGRVRPGDNVSLWPSGCRAMVAAISTWDGMLDEARAPQSVSIVLDREVDAGRGDLLAAGPIAVSSAFDADLVWMDDRPLSSDRLYLVKHRTGLVGAEIDGSAAPNDIARVRVCVSRPLCLDRYDSDRHLGSFIIIDPASGFTSGAGLVRRVSTAGAGQAAPLWPAADRLTRIARSAASHDDAAAAVHRALEALFK